MARKKDKKTIIDAGRAEGPKEPLDPEIEREFDEAQKLGGSGASHLARRLKEHHSRTPELSGGDVDAEWDRADVGEESVGGDNPTPDQDIVEEVANAVGINYEDNEPLRGAEKLEDRDRRRWEVDPASSEDYHERSRRKPEGEP
jgi:Family of unknown function (DUF6335)